MWVVEGCERIRQPVQYVLIVLVSLPANILVQLCVLFPY